MPVIGPYQLDPPMCQAALSGYSDLPMRRIAREFGAPYTLNEVILDKTVVQKGKKRKRILAVTDDDHPVGGQLMGADPDMFESAAAAMADAGYDIIDINFGCPVKKVLGRCRGGFLLSEPERALEIIGRVIGAVGQTHPVTVKMRRGMDDTRASEQAFFRILDGAFNLGVAGVTVHGRTVEQRYVGPSRWSFLAKVKRFARGVVVYGSGDLFSAGACMRMLEETGVDGVSIARGCIGNPWIFREFACLYAGRPLPAPPSIAEQGSTILHHYTLSEAVHGPSLAPRLMRKFGIKYSEHHPLARDVRDAFIAVKTGACLRSVIDRWYAADRDWPPVTRREGHGDLVAAGATA